MLKPEEIEIIKSARQVLADLYKRDLEDWAYEAMGQTAASVIQCLMELERQTEYDIEQSYLLSK